MNNIIIRKGRPWMLITDAESKLDDIKIIKIVISKRTALTIAGRTISDQQRVIEIREFIDQVLDPDPFINQSRIISSQKIELLMSEKAAKEILDSDSNDSDLGAKIKKIVTVTLKTKEFSTKNPNWLNPKTRERLEWKRYEEFRHEMIDLPMNCRHIKASRRDLTNWKKSLEKGIKEINKRLEMEGGEYTLKD